MIAQINSPNVTATSLLKANGSTIYQATNIGSVIKRLILDKGYSFQAIRFLAQHERFGALLNELLFCTSDQYNECTSEDLEKVNKIYDALGLTIYKQFVASDLPIYSGSAAQNFSIRGALSLNKSLFTKNRFYGQGMGTSLDIDAMNIYLPDCIAKIPIGIIGYGASGSIMRAVFTMLGFTNMTIFEPSKNDFGLWSYANVNQGSRNNPRALKMEWAKLAAAPGDGREVLNALKTLNSYGEPGTTHCRTKVIQVIPGNLHHRVITSEKIEHSFPVLINAMGIGKPNSLSDHRRLTTSISPGQAGYRWQQQLSREDVEGKSWLLIGLGNSTAEMLVQFYRLMREGAHFDFKIVTHYPYESVAHPTNDIQIGDQTFRMFRNLSTPNLTRFHGDLEWAREVYFRAWREGRIIPDAKRWDVKDGCYCIYGIDGQIITQGRYDRIATLIGYSHSPETYEAMGCVYDPEIGGINTDFDGEIQTNSLLRGAKYRLHKGYFGLGPFIRNSDNLNAVVIPGIIHQIHDLLFALIMRATEWHVKNNAVA